MQEEPGRLAQQKKLGVDHGLLVVAGFVLLEILFAYPQAVVEADSLRVGYGIIHGIETGEGMRSGELYGRAFSFGYYALFFLLYPPLFADYGALPAVMNAFNLAATAGALLAIHRWTRLLWGEAVALAIALLTALTPLLFELGGYGHPEGPAFLGLNLAILALLHAVRPESRWPRLGLAAATAAAFAGAAMRADIFLGFPFLPFLAPLAAGPGKRSRAFRQGLLVVIVAAGAFFAAQQAVAQLTPPRIAPIPGHSSEVQPGTLELLAEFWRGAASLDSVPKGLVVWATALGPMLLVLGFVGLLGLGLRWRNERREVRAESLHDVSRFVLPALALIVPSALFWLPNPTPARHLLLTCLGLVPAAVIWLRALFPRRWFPAVIGFVLVANLTAMNAIVPVLLKNYQFVYTSLLPRRVILGVPMGDPITARVWARRQLKLEMAQTEQMVAAREPKLLVIGRMTSLRLIHDLYATGEYAVDYEWRHEAFLRRVTTPKTEYVIYVYAGAPTPAPAEFMRRVGEAGDFRDFAVALAPTDTPVAEPAVVPPGYRSFTFDLAPLIPGWKAEKAD